MEIIKKCEDIKNIQNGCICLYVDFNEHINMILKDPKIEKIKELQLVHFSKNYKEIIILKVNGEETYKGEIEYIEENQKILNKLNRMDEVNIIHFSNDLDKQHILSTKYQKVKESKV